MSVRSVMVLSLAILAIAVACTVMLSTDSDAAPIDDLGLAEYREDMQKDSFMKPVLGQEMMRQAPRTSDGPAPGMAKPMSKGPQALPLGEIADSDVPGPVEINVPRYIGPVPMERIIDDFEVVFKEKRDLESQGRTVEVVDDNEYADIQAEVVTVMMDIIDSDTDDISEEGFLPALLVELETRDMASAASTVRDMLEYRASEEMATTGVLLPGSKSKDGPEDDEDDINAAPYRFDEAADDDEESFFIDTPIFTDDGDVPILTSNDLSVRPVDRGCIIVF